MHAPCAYGVTFVVTWQIIAAVHEAIDLVSQYGVGRDDPPKPEQVVHWSGRGHVPPTTVAYRQDKCLELHALHPSRRVVCKL